MKRYSIFLVLLLMATNGFSQAGLILKSGRTMPYSKLEAQPNYLDVWPSLEIGKVEIDIDSVVAYYTFGKAKDVLRMKVPDNSGDGENNYQFLP